MVSVIVPVYKSEKTLERCVESLLAQTCQDMEILLIVESPPDPSGILCDRLAALDSRIRVLHQANQGVSASRNYGISKARGEYIRFVDSDDYVLPDSLGILMDAMQRTDADLVIAGYHHHYFGRKIQKLPKAGGRMKYEIAKEEDYLYQLYQTGFLNMPWNKLYKRELIRELFQRELNLGEDLLFNLAYLAGAKTFTVVPLPVCEYIQDDRGTTLSTRRRENKLTLTVRLYAEVQKAFGRIYPGHKTSGVLTDKLVSEFLDDVEGLAFEKGMRAADKKQIIRTYEKQLVHMLRGVKEEIHLELLDYKIIYFFMKRKQTDMVYLMVCLRGIVVRLLNKR